MKCTLRCELITGDKTKILASKAVAPVIVYVLIHNVDKQWKLDICLTQLQLCITIKAHDLKHMLKLKPKPLCCTVRGRHTNDTMYTWFHYLL